MQCDDGGKELKDTKFNLLVRQHNEECHELLKAHPPKTPCQVVDRKPPTLHTFCQHNVRTEYRYKDGKPSIGVCPCGAMRSDVKAKQQQKQLDESFAEAIQCISRKLPRYFYEPTRCDPMSVCCRMFGGPKHCPNRGPDICACKSTLNKDKFNVNYPPNRLTVRNIVRENSDCHPYVRCSGKCNNATEFRPDYSTQALTEKFYARHDCLKMERTPRVIFYEEEIQKGRDFYPRDYYCIPRYSNQVYGWNKGKKLLHLENCDAGANERVLNSLSKLDNAKIEPIQLHYCLCKERRKDDHWKIV